MVMAEIERKEVDERVNLLDFDLEGIRAWCAEHGEKPFRATQLARWIHRFCVDDFDPQTA